MFPENLSSPLVEKRGLERSFKQVYCDYEKNQPILVQVVAYEWFPMIFGSTSRVLDQVISIAITKGWENTPTARIGEHFNLSAVEFPFKADVLFTEFPLKVATKHDKSTRRVAQGTSKLKGNDASGSFSGASLEIIIEHNLEAKAISMIMSQADHVNASYRSEWNEGKKLFSTSTNL